MMNKKAYIYVCNVYAGVLEKNDDGYEFTYEKNYLESEYRKAVSLTLPLREEVYKSKTLFAFFDGLIPEGWLLKVVSDNWKINPNDRFEILLVACNDTFGNVSVRGGLE